MAPQVPLWQAVMPTDREADFGQNSDEAMRLALWLQQRALEYTVADSAPLDWGKVYAVLDMVEVPTADPIRPVFERVRDRIGIWAGIPISSVA